jgi:hypothetical protein
MLDLVNNFNLLMGVGIIGMVFFHENKEVSMLLKIII